MFGVMKPSSDGQLIAAAYNSNFIELYKFNNLNGKLTHSIRIPVSNPFGVEFSNNSKLLYVSSDTFGFAQQRRILQFDISNYDFIQIINSQKVVSIKSNNFGSAGHIQMGPDGHLYIANSSSKNLDVILKPNLLDSLCEYKDSLISLGNRQIFKSLPYAHPFYSQHPTSKSLPTQLPQIAEQ